VCVEPVAEGGQRGGLREFFGSTSTETQADRIRETGGNAAANDERVALESFKRLRPRFAAVDVGAVGEMQAVVELHPTNQAPRRNFGHCERKRTGFW